MLLEHNKQTLIELESFVSKNQNCCVVNPCGSGKTSIMSAFIKNHPERKIIVFTKQKKAKDYYNRTDAIFGNVYVTTYNKMQRDCKNGVTEPYDADTYILDEAHYAGAEKWGFELNRLIAMYNPLLVGFTATPQRYANQGTDVTIVTDLFDNNSAGNFTVNDLCRKGVFKEPEYVLSLYNFENDVTENIVKIMDSDIEDDRKEAWVKKLQSALDDWKEHSAPDIVLKDKLPQYMYKDRCNRILIYTPSVSDLQTYRKIFDKARRNVFNKRIKSYSYTHNDSENELTEFLKEDKAYIKILYSIDKIMETVHIDDLNIMIMLRPSVSNRIITQQFGRVNSIGNANKPLIIDMVGNLANLNATNFLGGHTEKKSDNGNTKINLKYVKAYGDLFNEVDKVCSKSILYKYDGFVGTLYQIAHVYDVSYRALRKLILDDNMEIEDALKSLKRNHKASMRQNIFDGYETLPNFTLTESQRKLAEDRMILVDDFIRRHQIKDEDIKQNLYIVYMGVIAKHENDDVYTLTSLVITALTHHYISAHRHSLLRKDLFVYGIPQESEYIDYSGPEKEYFLKVINELLNEELMTIPVREEIVLTYHYGLYNEHINKYACELTLSELASMLQKSPSWGHTHHAQGMRHMRARVHTNRLKWALDVFDDYDYGDNK